jgi:hypothetical protein
VKVPRPEPIAPVVCQGPMTGPDVVADLEAAAR